ncbi:arginine/serine-rich protein PNISR [Anopheles funestus]|uniref:arginine/serine-rich protein PNISR n=1 Tax=Anopheles funestus TaxID=62324 RepID=UPI0020C6E48A|nr:arginine/serine-rich protein PNISR [Anopheles funestus]XP_049296182.1 arginine/serine-rich protein PNISR [Anopheles funestus]
MMNRHGASNSNRPVEQGQLFSAMMSDIGPNQGAFVPGSNAFSLSHYQNMPNDQVDWAALAQQWIKMRETWMQPMSTMIPSPPPPPSFDRDTFDGAAGSNAPPRNRIIAGVEFEEQGEAPMEVEREDDGDIPVPPTPPKITNDCQPADETWRTWSWPMSMGSTSTLGNQHAPQALPNNQKLTDTQQRSGTGPPASAAAAIALWQAKNSHLFPVAYPKDSATMPREQTAANRRTFSTQPTKPSRLPGLMDREIKISASSSADVHRIDAKENVSGGGGAGSATINEEKRMMLPAWIREGLEKMEREKQQKLKREQEHRQREEKLSSQQNLHSLSPSPSREELTLPLSAPLEQEESQPKQEKVALNEQNIEQITKKILTEVFMETTNEVLLGIAQEEQSKVQKRKAKQAATSNVGRATYTRGLGLGIYGDSDEDEDEEEDQMTNDISKGSNSVNVTSDLESANNSDDDVSDTEAMRKMMEKILVRQQNFKSTAAQIEKWLGEVSEYTPHNAELQTEPLSSDEGSYEGQHGQRSDDADSDPAREGRTESPRHGKAGTGNGFGTSLFTPFGSTAQQSDQTNRASGSQENVVRKRREKRVSRFSDPRDTVRTTHITHVSIVSPSAETACPSKALEQQPAAKNVATVGGSTVRPKYPAQESKPRQTAAQQSYNAYLSIPSGQPYQTIYSITPGPKGTGCPKALSELVKSNPPSNSDGGKKSLGEESDSGSYRRKYRDRSRSRSSHGSRTSASRSGSFDSRSSRSTQSPNSHYSRSGQRRRSSSKRSRHDRDRSPLDRHSPSSYSSSRRHRRDSGNSSRSRSRSSSKYSSRRRF